MSTSRLCQSRSSLPSDCRIDFRSLVVGRYVSHRIGSQRNAPERFALVEELQTDVDIAAVSGLGLVDAGTRHSVVDDHWRQHVDLLIDQLPIMLHEQSSETKDDSVLLVRVEICAGYIPDSNAPVFDSVDCSRDE